MREKTFKLVHILYVLFITNLISILYLLIGLFSLTLVPVIFTNIEISNMLFDDEIDGYSGISKIFNLRMKKYYKENLKSVIITGIYSLFLVVSIIMLKNMNNPIASALNYLFVYLYIVISIYWAYYSLYVIVKEKPIKHIDALAIMFMKPKKLVITVGLFVLFMILALLRKEFLVVLAIAIVSAIFVKVNKSTVQGVNINR